MKRTIALEYHLPNGGVGWKVANEISNKNKVVYIPENTTILNAKEVFSVHVNYFPMDINNRDLLEEGIKTNYPNKEVCINFLEKAPQTVLYEWSVKDADQEKVHGWTRGFVNPQVTVFLNYQTEQMNEVNNVSSAWIKTLKEAKFEK